LGENATSSPRWRDDKTRAQRHYWRSGRENQEKLLYKTSSIKFKGELKWSIVFIKIPNTLMGPGVSSNIGDLADELVHID
jgi:hypothetical protein